MVSIYSAKWVLPISSPSIKNGAIAIDGKHIVGIGTQEELKARFADAEVKDFGEAVILPGLINCHTHLDLTAMRGYLERVEGDFFAWLNLLTTTKRSLSKEDLYISSLWGIVEAIRAGITCVGDVSDNAGVVLKALNCSGLRATLYQEYFGADPRLANEFFKQIRETLPSIRTHETPLVKVGISPHAPYTVSTQLLRLIVPYAIEESLPVMMHASESTAEDLLMREGRGPFAERFTERGIDWKPPGISTVQYLAKLGLLDTKLLLAHCTRVDEADIETLKSSKVGIAHCPKSNAKLGHNRSPYYSLIKNRMNVGFGSDSVASNNTCDILEEARFAVLLSRIGTNIGTGYTQMIRASQALHTATLGGASALGYKALGELKEGALADLIIVALDKAHQLPVQNPVNSLIFASSGRDVILTMIDGKEVYRDGHVLTIDEDWLRREIEKLGMKLGAISTKLSHKA
jgi:aminodeoxyfutalosine deaminase